MTRIFQIFKAEFRRTFYDRSNLVYVGITILFCILLLSFSFVSVFDSNKTKALQTYEKIFAFPNSLYSVLSLSYSFYFFLIPVITSQIIGSDYRLDTWKMILPRISRRTALLTGKLLNLALYLIFLLLIAAIIYHICTIIGALWLGTTVFSATSFETGHDLRLGLTSVLATLSFIVWYISIGTLITIISRSVIVGTFSCFVIFAISNLIRSYSPEYISIWLAPSHFRNLVPAPEYSVAVFDGRPNCTAFFSWFVVSAHILIAFLASFFVFEKQEFASKL